MKTQKSLNLNYKDFWFSHFRKWQVEFLPANFFLQFNQPFSLNFGYGKGSKKN